MVARRAAHSPASARSAGGALFQKRMTAGAAKTAYTSPPSAAVSGRIVRRAVCSGNDMAESIDGGGPG